MTLREFFDTHPWINQSQIARLCKINDGLFRQYVTGIKRPSDERLKYIEREIKGIINETKDFKLTLK